VSSSVIAGMAGKRLWLVGGLLLVAIVLLAWVIVPVARRHFSNIPRHLRLEPPSDATAADATVFKPRVAPAQTTSVQGNGFVGGPRQISVQLKPWKSSLRQSALFPGKSSSAFDRLKERRAKAQGAAAPRELERKLPP